MGNIKNIAKNIIKKTFIYGLLKSHNAISSHRLKDMIIKKTGKKIKSYAEIGVASGDTTLYVCNLLKPNSSIYIFDYENKIENVFKKIESKFPRKFKVYKIGNSSKERDSYCWGLINLIKQNPNRKIFDYVYIDGSHDLVIDGFAFYLVDMLLNKGGYIEFDDYNWTFLKSPTMNPEKYSRIVELYTEEQLTIPHVKLIVDNLVKTNIRYREIAKNRLYQKIR